MLRGIVVAIGVSVLVLGGILPGQAEDRDRDDDGDKKGGHRAILNAVNSGNAQHGQLSKEITAVSGGHQGILDALTGGTSSSNAAHTTIQSEHVTQSTAHGTLQSEHDAQNSAHQGLSNQIDAVQKAVDGLSGGGGQEGNHTLRWDQVLPASARFVVMAAFNDEAVLDNETGLVWEKAPAPTPAAWGGGGGARFQCTARVTGGRKGWRLPSFAELSSLVDPSVASPGPSLPLGHPFSATLPVFYWSATVDAGNLNLQGGPILQSAWGVDFSNGNVGTLLKTFTGFVWCVRGGMNADQY